MEQDGFLCRLNAREATQKSGFVYDLPTEAEWEYVARAGTTTPFFFGGWHDEDQIEDYGYYEYNSGDCVHPVKTLRPNPWGLYDIYGHVFEWCKDVYSPSYSCNANSLDTITVDPQGPLEGQERVMRGGCWFAPGRCCRSALREKLKQKKRAHTVGFRLVRRNTAAGVTK
jgi:formylglycine-generating enzyme required for sulfatase activity